ncbi:MAG: hypothetical protein N2049_01705, partial [Anaerolineales bacterium]|nr:hypothetical protein [Anaerolineales bacterium]
VHIEVQGQSDPDLAKRLFTYNYRLFDRYDRLLEQQFLTQVHEYERSQNMPCISTAERSAIERGLQQGLQQSTRLGETEVLRRLLRRKLGILPE